MIEYASRALKPGAPGTEADLKYVADNRDTKASAIYWLLEDFRVAGDSLGVQIARGGKIAWQGTGRSLSEIETLIKTARKTIKYEASQRDFTGSIEQMEVVLERVRIRTYRYASATLDRLLFESVPEHVLDRTRLKVDGALASACPQALEKFRVAYEQLSGSSAENWTNVCTAVRRILLDFADAVYSPRDDLVEGRKVGKEEYVNRLWAYAKQEIVSSTQRELTLAELEDLGKRIDAIYASSNKGVHDVVRQDEAERILIRTYLLIADLLPP